MATDDIDCGACADTGTLEIFYEMDDEGRALYLTTPCDCRDTRTVAKPFVEPQAAEVPAEDLSDVPF